MKHLLRRSVHLPLLLSSLFAFHNSRAQTVDSIDNIVLKIPAAWQVTRQATFIEAKLFDKKIKSFCQVLVWGQQPATKNKQTDFSNEWKELVEKNFTMLTSVKPIVMKDKKGNSFWRYGAKGMGSDGTNYFIQLNMYECGNANQTVMAVSGNKNFLAKYDSLWQPLIAKVKKQNTSTILTTTTTATTNSNNQLVGTWHKSSSSPSAYINGVINNLAYSGYTKGEYNFKSDGSFTFQGESWSGYYNSNEYRLVDESGVYAVNGNQLTLTPSNSLYRVVDGDGKGKKSEKLSLNKRNYTWQTHYYEGLQETAMVLSSSNENAVDGGFSSSEQFPKSFIYSPGKRLEFSFLPHKF